MTVAQLLEDLKVANPNDTIVVVLEDAPNSGDFEDLEPGSVCEISEAGGFMSGMRVIRAFPR